jgi:hypothetical protein
VRHSLAFPDPPTHSKPALFAPQARLRSEIQHQQSQLDLAAREVNDLKRANAQFERELSSIAASDHTESLVYPQRDRRMQESRVVNTLASIPSAYPARGESLLVRVDVGRRNQPRSLFFLRSPSDDEGVDATTSVSTQAQLRVDEPYVLSLQSERPVVQLVMLRSPPRQVKLGRTPDAFFLSSYIYRILSPSSLLSFSPRTG